MTDVKEVPSTACTLYNSEQYTCITLTFSWPFYQHLHALVIFACISSNIIPDLRHDMVSLVCIGIKWSMILINIFSSLLFPMIEGPID